MRLRYSQPFLQGLSAVLYSRSDPPLSVYIQVSLFEFVICVTIVPHLSYSSLLLHDTPSLFRLGRKPRLRSTANSVILARYNVPPTEAVRRLLVTTLRTWYERRPRTRPTLPRPCSGWIRGWNNSVRQTAGKKRNAEENTKSTACRTNDGWCNIAETIATFFFADAGAKTGPGICTDDREYNRDPS